MSAEYVKGNNAWRNLINSVGAGSFLVAMLVTTGFETLMPDNLLPSKDLILRFI